MPARQLAVQLYTLRDFTKTPADIAKTLSRVRQMGYHAVQLSALGPIDPKELNTILQGEGLAVAATHVGLDRMKNETQAVIDEHRLWGCQYTAIGGYFKENPTRADWLEFARTYNQVADRFEGTGVRLGYHNHSHELAHYDGQTALALLIEQCKPAIWMEIDTYWIQHGGGDPAAWIAGLKGRIPCVHLKDMTITPQRQQQMAEVGTGNLNWPAILKACEQAAVQWYIVEQDICQRDPFESLEISLKNLQAMGLQ